MSEPSKPTGPDLAQGIPLDDLADGGMIGGHVGRGTRAACAPRR